MTEGAGDDDEDESDDEAVPGSLGGGLGRRHEHARGRFLWTRSRLANLCVT